MSHPTKLPAQRLRRFACAAAMPLGLLAASVPASADDAVSLAHVARQLGFTYRYLPYENAVELIRPGGVVVVRPGAGFFDVNGRTEPVYGMEPEYRNNDVYVSPSFVNEIRSVGEAYHYSGPTGSYGRARVVATGTVTDLKLTHRGATNLLTVTGHGTPGAPVTIVLTALISEDLPVTPIDTVEAVTDSTGVFATVVSLEPIHFALARFRVEASSPSNTSPVVATIDPSERNPDSHTPADDPDKRR